MKHWPVYYQIQGQFLVMALRASELFVSVSQNPVNIDCSYGQRENQGERIPKRRDNPEYCTFSSAMHSGT